MAERESNGQFAAGHAKIEGSGVKKGQKRRSSEMVDRLFDFFESGKVQEDLVKSWTMLDPKEKWDTYTKCLKHMAPTIKTISFDDDNKAVSSIFELVHKMAEYKK